MRIDGFIDESVMKNRGASSTTSRPTADTTTNSAHIVFESATEDKPHLENGGVEAHTGAQPNSAPRICQAVPLDV